MEVRCFSLQEQEFAKLVRGEAVQLELFGGTTIEVKLADVGWDRMYFQIERAMRDKQAKEGVL